jgi:DNA modification methylase
LPEIWEIVKLPDMFAYPARQSQALLSAFSPLAEYEVAPQYEELHLHTGPVSRAMDYLAGVDWSFTDDDTRFLGHDLHPYPAKFIPQLPGTLIGLLSSRGELVFDPFGGSGTTALEAVRLGRRALSLDANPVATLIGRVKTARVTPNCTSELHSLHAALRAFMESVPIEAGGLIAKFAEFAPQIANREKWFADSAFGELAQIRFRIGSLETSVGRDIASLAMSRTVLSASFQDSETRYKSVPREVPMGETTRKFLREFESVMKSVARNAAATRYGVAEFLTGDARQLGNVPDSSVALVATSPPYGNATDYHLYHRFRLLWLGHDPIALGKVEIGSHLKHQRESSGFDSYFEDMRRALDGIGRVLMPARYAALVIGDSVYEGKTYSTAELLAEVAKDHGFDTSRVIERTVHATRRSFTPAGRRALSESILVLRKKERAVQVLFGPPPYAPWPYEKQLSQREIRAAGVELTRGSSATLKGTGDVRALLRCRSLVFTHSLGTGEVTEKTWQAILENGTAVTTGARKDPKYVTHGIHAYKGKFYPQLAKGLINQLGLEPGAKILDPFCGSGTTLLEGHLNGFATYGCDLHPLAAKIAKAKTAILDVNPDVVTEAVTVLLEQIEAAPSRLPAQLDQFDAGTHEEIERWFAAPVARKLNWLLKTIRAGSDGAVRDFLEVVVSSIVRDVSQQEPSDLRIRYRRELLADADVFSAFTGKLEDQYGRVEKFWKVRGHAPNSFFPSHAIAGDNREPATYGALGLTNKSVDLVLTSPPYAMALPYIDTDRLSLLLLFGLDSSKRRPLEQILIGSRELNVSEKKRQELNLSSGVHLPSACIAFVQRLHRMVLKSADSGFRKQNMPALVYRFLTDMDAVLIQLYRLCKIGGEVMMVIGDSKMNIEGNEIRIPSTDLVQEIAESIGFTFVERIDISVTTENLLHIKNAITENVVLRFKRGS